MCCFQDNLLFRKNSPETSYRGEATCAVKSRSTSSLLLPDTVSPRARSSVCAAGKGCKAAVHDIVGAHADTVRWAMQSDAGHACCQQT